MGALLLFELYNLFALALLGVARLAPLFFMLPFLNSGVLTAAPRQAVMVLLALALTPLIGEQLPALDSLAFFALMLREAGVGIVLGCLLCWPFWVLHAMGNLLDNQRGAMISNVIDPANGVDNSELASFLQLFAAVIYLQGGGLLLMLEAIELSYRLCDPGRTCAFSLQAIASFLDAVLARTLALSAPVVAALLISEALLGLLSRYAQQMNAFSVSLTVKTVVALVVLLLYFGTHLPDEILRMTGATASLALYIQEQP